MTRVLLVPDLPIERWPSMDRYALRLGAALGDAAPDIHAAFAGDVAPLTAERAHTETRTKFRPTDNAASEAARYLRRYVVYPRRVRRRAADIVHVLDHSYAHIRRAARGRPVVITVHDLLPALAVERKATSVRERVRNRLLTWVLDHLRAADRWIVATAWLRAELGAWLGSEDRIDVVPYGVDDAFFEAGTPAVEWRRRYEVPDEAFVVLHVGSTGARKNMEGVMATVAGLRQRGIDAWFLQVGGVISAAQRRDLQRLRLGAAFTALGPTPEPELRDAYRAADVLLFPSHYEGFGFPVLEAMASGLPVVTSGAGGLTEVAGDAAVVVGGREVEPYVEATLRIADDADARAELVERGRTRARAFSWAECGRRTAEVYRALV